MGLGVNLSLYIIFLKNLFLARNCMISLLFEIICPGGGGGVFSLLGYNYDLQHRGPPQCFDSYCLHQPFL